MKAEKMNRQANILTIRAGRGTYAGLPRACAFFGASLVVTAVLVWFADPLLPSRVVRTGDAHLLAKIQLDPNRKGLCRHLVFHNDTGRFKEEETGQCSDITSQADQIRTEAFERVFKSR